MALLSDIVAPLMSRICIIIDPLGNIPLVLALLQNIHPKRARFIIWREMVIALIAMALFAVCGAKLLATIGVDQRSIGVSGGLILFLIALKMIFPDQHGSIAHRGTGEPFFFPLAVPLVAGPSMLVTMVEVSQKLSLEIILFALCSAWLVCTSILLVAAHLKNLLGACGIMLCERIMGLVLAFISAQMFLNGLTEYFG